MFISCTSPPEHPLSREIGAAIRVSLPDDAPPEMELGIAGIAALRGWLWCLNQPHMLHIWSIYLHLPHKWPKCR